MQIQTTVWLYIDLVSSDFGKSLINSKASSISFFIFYVPNYVDCE